MRSSIQHGGLFVYEFFAATPDHPENPHLADLEQRFAGWDLLRHEVVEDTPDWQRNRAMLIRFVDKRP